MNIRQWIQVTTTHTTGGHKWVMANLYIENGAIKYWYEVTP